MTSNIGSQFILERAQASEWDEVETFVRGELHHHFRPEFLNRVDDVILFRPLAEDGLRAIVDLQLDRVQALADDLGVTLVVSAETRDIIAREGHDPAYGARPLKRAIQRLIQDPLALKLLEVEVAEGTTVRVVPGEGNGPLEFLLEPGAGQGDQGEDQDAR
jgi:ATP-dependent Clp protease ATP-binding subunit ClpB